LMEPFTKNQAIRLLRRRIGEHVDMKQLKRQHIITSCCISGSFGEIKKLNDSVCGWKRLFVLPQSDEADIVRDYFGEQMGLFSLWIATALRGLRDIGLLAIILSCVWLYTHITGVTWKWMRYAQMIFLLAILIWLLCVNSLFARAASRKAQYWGMTNRNAKYWGLRASVLFGSNEGKPLSQRRKACHRFVNSCITIGYFLFSVALLTSCLMFAEEYASTRHDLLRCIPTAMLSLLLKEVWVRVAEALTGQEDFAVNTLWERALATKFFLINVSVTLYPAIYIAFIKKILERKCGGSLEEVANDLFSFDVGQTCPVVLEALRNVQATTFHNETLGGTSQTCITGCYPNQCRFSAVDGHCETYSFNSNCTDMLHNYIWIYLFMFLVEHACKLLPAYLSPANASVELHRVVRLNERRPTHTQLLVENPVFNNKHFHVTHRNSPNRLSNPGVRNTENFTDFTALFAMIICFGAVMPGLFWVGGFVFLGLYRAKMYTLVHIMQRPYPVGRENIGKFDKFIYMITLLAIICNGGHFCFLFSPMRYSWVWQQQVLGFTVLEHSLLCLFVLSNFLFDREPVDIDRITAHNHRIILRLEGNELHNPHICKHAEIQDTDSIDVSVYGGLAYPEPGSPPPQTSSTLRRRGM